MIFTARPIAALLVLGFTQAWLSLGCAGAMAQQALGPTFTRTADGLEAAMLPSRFPSSHAANLLVRRNGDVLCFWFSGTREGESDVAIVVSRLPKNSSTWQVPVVVDHDPGKSYQNPVPYEDAKGRLWLMHTAQTANKGQADAQVLRVYSDDGGVTWSRPQVMFGKAGSFLRQPPVEGADHSLLLPLYYSTTEGITTGAETNYSAVEISRDNGTTWRECVVPGSEGLVQMNLIRMAGRTGYVAFFRSRYADFIYRATSADGCAWTAPKPTRLPNNNASIQAVLLRDGTLMMAFDNARGKPAEGTARLPQTGPRAPLTVACSQDGGMTWTGARDVELPDAVAHHAAQTGATASPADGHAEDLPSKEEYSYPSIVQMPDGQVLLAYTYRRVAIKAVRFDEAWVRQGRTIGAVRP